MADKFLSALDLAVITSGAGTATTEPAGSLAKSPGGGTLKSNGTTWDVFGGGGMPSVTEVDVDFGARSTSSTGFVVVNVDATTAARAVAWMIGPGPGRDADEAEEPFTVTAIPGSGTVTLIVCPLIGPVHGTWRVGYQLLFPI